MSFLLLLSVQVAVPLTPGVTWLTSWLTIVCLVSTCGFLARLSWGFHQIATTAAIAFGLAMAIEGVGIRTGFPFGSYSYTDSLQPQLLGVPVLVGVAWVSMLLPAWELGRRLGERLWLQCLGTGVALAIWDIFLDPQMTKNGFWVLHSGGWKGISVVNSVGWIVSGSLLAVVPAIFLNRHRANNGLAFVYVWMVLFSALGFLIPFAFDDPAIGVVGTVCAAPLLYFAFNQRDRRWLASQ